ncbi:hypothetical protein J1N09_01525 [Aureitalea sp. L0-47]|uniref:hypothetical protein n=1 Tax=Aureitalea sp. L0-47 TaxID=2816962 RepID=UPI002238F44C|nr:hypothetical protein [Aureitalea sp. L0-47]MCW5518500.1 hypothetical protein [Aureitalea sp. L0-47]
MPNNFYRLPELPEKSNLDSLVDNLQYKRLSISELPVEIRSNGLTDKFNSVILAKSASTEVEVYTFVGIRPDKNQIDEHPFLYCYDKDHGENGFGGIIHHGHWDGRTTELSPEQEHALSSSGLTANFTYKGIPSNSSGSLSDLEEKGMLEGITEQFRILLRNR